MVAKGARSLRNVEKQKKRAATLIPRAKVTRSKGNTKAARTALKRASGKARATAKPAG